MSAGNMLDNQQVAEQTNESTSTHKKKCRITGSSLSVLKALVSSGSSPEIISRTLGISPRSARRWAAEIQTNPDVKLGSPGRPKIDNQERKNEIAVIVGDDCALTGVGIVERMPKSMQFSRSTMCRDLKSMNYTRKRLKQVVAERNSARVIGERYSYALRFTNIRDDEAVFIDETGFNLHVCSHYGYAPSGETPSMTVPTQRGQNVSVIAAIDISGVISFKIIMGAVNRDLMSEWCREELLPAIAGRHITFVMDNVRFHHSTVVTEALTSDSSRAIFLPPYSPQLNPIEQFFSRIKQLYTAHRPRPTNVEELRSTINSIFQSFRGESLNAYYANMRDWVSKALQRQDFI